jgi:tyrosinase
LADAVVLRPDIEQADIASLSDAYAKMQGLSASDNRSWIFWSQFHGFDRYDCWHHARSGPPPGAGFPYDLFLPWHRAYLLNFEHVARDQNHAAILPWWDWTSDISHQVGIPQSFSDPGPGGQGNPLASGPMPDMPGSPARPTQRSPGDPSELPSLTDPDPALGLPSIDDVLGLTSYVDFSNQIQNVHDQMHGWVGGDMGSVPTSAFDPIFWSHHCMIDRLWYLWQLQHGPNNIPTDYLDKVLAPFSLTVAQVLDVRSLGYDYATSVASTTVSTAPVTTAATGQGGT